MDAVLEAIPFLVRADSGRLHIRYRLYNRSIDHTVRTVDDGRCGIDENWVKVDESILESADPDRLCDFCFPSVTRASAATAHGVGAAGGIGQ